MKYLIKLFFEIIYKEDWITKKCLDLKIGIGSMFQFGVISLRNIFLKKEANWKKVASLQVGIKNKIEISETQWFQMLKKFTELRPQYKEITLRKHFDSERQISVQPW